ncbi:TonB-dependent receptor [Dysgonomonas sp. OttesenSCG-928-M03]|nr:TonB-dependent receptor [Dysgonomonas sp. OttesenSCG-928-M03]
MKKLMLFVILFVTVFGANAQITGKVVDVDNNPVEFATVVLQTIDSTYINSAYTDSLGGFDFNSELKSYHLIVQHLMYEVSENTFHSQNCGIIQLADKEHSLDEVVVKGERPVVRVVEGRLTYDMPQLLQGKVVSNAYESLLQLPGVREQDDNLVLAGAKSLTVILNGKPTTMTGEQLAELLKNTPKERIEKAEVMYSAPPQYHVRGAAINLILKGGSTDAPNLQGQVNAGYSQSHYANFSGGLTLLYSTPKFSTDFMYSFGSYLQRRGSDLLSHHLYDGLVHDIEQHNRGYGKGDVHNIRLGNDFYVDDKNKLSLIYTGQIKPWQNLTESSKGTYSNSENRKKHDSPAQMHNITLNYTSGFGLNAGADYTFYKSHSTQNYQEFMTGKQNAFEALSKQDINRISAYVDQSHSLSSDWNLNYGINFMYASDKSSQVYHSLLDKDISDSDSRSQLKEYTYNFYAGFEKSFSDKLSASFSLAGEYYKHRDFDEWSLFPTLELTYVASPAHTFQLSVSSDKTYPDYWTMTSSVSYMNGYTEIHGNPSLRPYKDYSAQFSYILKNKYVFSAYVNYIDDYFSQLPYQSPERLALIYKTMNFNYEQVLGLNMTIPFKIGSVIDSRFSLDGFYDKVKSDNYYNSSFNNDIFTFFTSLNNTINISSKPNIKMELSGMYLPRNIQGPSKITKMYKIDAGIKWIFANDKAELRLRANDIFNSWSPDNWSMKFDHQNLNMHIIPDSRYINLSFSYKFGGFKEKRRKDVDTSRFAK